MNTATHSRLDRIKRRQAAALDGTYRRSAAVAAPRTAEPEGNGASESQPGELEIAGGLHAIDAIAILDDESADALRGDFDAYLGAVAQMYAYTAENKAFISDLTMPPGVDLVGDPQARAAVRERIRAWQVDLIANNWAAPVGNEDLEYRARTTFRQVVMGMTTDENGRPYPGVAARDFIENARVTSKVKMR